MVRNNIYLCIEAEIAHYLLKNSQLVGQEYTVTTLASLMLSCSQISVVYFIYALNGVTLICLCLQIIKKHL